VRSLMLLGTVISAVAVAGCGGTSSGTDAGNGNTNQNSTFVCDQVLSNGHFCWEYSAPVASITAFTEQCQARGGTSPSSCSHTGAVGACRVVAGTSPATVTTTSWFYFGEASTLKLACTAETTGNIDAPRHLMVDKREPFDLALRGRS
jgi:hypothetical protein